MTDKPSPAVEIVTAVAMPAAIIVVALCVLAVVIIFTSKRSAMRLKVRDWVEIDGHATPTPQVPSVPEPNQMAPAIVAPSDGPISTEDSSPVEAGPARQSESQERSASSLFFTAKEASELEAAFKELTADPASYVCTDREFWETWYTDRYHALDKSPSAPALHELSEAQTTWSWPSVYLMRFYSNSGRFEEAERQLNIGLARKGSKGYSNLLTEGATLYFSHVSPERAFEFIRERIAGGASDAEVSSMMTAIAAQASPEPFGNLILREVGLGLDPSRSGDLWKLAYEYGEHTYSELISYRRYRELVLADESTSSSLNNMGVIASNYDDQLGILHQEEALAKGDPYAIGNIANRLINAGFLERAKELLDSTDDNETPTIMRARSALLDAIRARDKKLEKLRNLAAAEGNRLRAFALKAYNQWLAGAAPPFGRYEASDGAAGLDVAGHTADCTITIADRKFQGTLSKLSLCYDGEIRSTKAGETILTSKSRRVLAMLTDKEEITLVTFNPEAKFEPLYIVKTVLTYVPDAKPEEDSDI